MKQKLSVITALFIVGAFLFVCTSSAIPPMPTYDGTGAANITTTNVMATTANITGITVANVINATTLTGDGSGITGIGATAATALSFTAKAAENLVMGQAVYISSASGNNPVVSLADNTNTAKSRVVGLAASTVSKNGTLLVRRGGVLSGVTVTAGGNVNADGGAWTAGDLVFLTTGGKLTKTRPTSGRSVKVAYVLETAGTSDLLVYPLENPVWVTSAANEDIVLRLGDAAGANVVSIRDYANAQVASINSDGGITAVAANITGSLTANVTIITDSATANVTAAQMMGQTHLMTANVTLSLPSSVVGYSGLFQVSGGNYTARIDVANATDVIVLNGTALTAGYKATNSSTIYDEIYCVCRAAGKYICTAIQGLWVDGGS